MDQQLLNRLSLGEIIRVVFYDHSRDGKELILSEVFGKVLEVSKDKIVLANWDTFQRDDEMRELSQETVAIAISCVASMTILRSDMVIA